MWLAVVVLVLIQFAILAGMAAISGPPATGPISPYPVVYVYGPR